MTDGRIQNDDDESRDARPDGRTEEDDGTDDRTYVYIRPPFPIFEAAILEIVILYPEIK